MVLKTSINPLNPELNPICHLLALLGAHHILHVSSIRVKICRITPKLVTIEQKYRALYIRTDVCFTLLAATYVAKQCRERMAVFPWQRF